MSAFFLSKVVLLAITLGFALYYDITEGKIKNKVTLSAACLGLILNYLEAGTAGMTTAFSGWLIPTITLFVFYYLKVMGAGDIKLFAAIGSIMGLPFALYSFLFTIYIGGAIAVVLLIKRKKFLSRFQYFYIYTKLLIISRKIRIYRPPEDFTSTFIFATAIVPGTLIQLVRSILKLRGWV